MVIIGGNNIPSLGNYKTYIVTRYCGCGRDDSIAVMVKSPNFKAAVGPKASGQYRSHLFVPPSSKFVDIAMTCEPHTQIIRQKSSTVSRIGP